MKIYVPAAEALRKKKRQDVTQLPPKLVENLLFCEIFDPSYAFDALYMLKLGRSHPLIARLYGQLYYFGPGFCLAT